MCDIHFIFLILYLNILNNKSKNCHLKFSKFVNKIGDLAENNVAKFANIFAKCVPTSRQQGVSQM